MQRPSMSGRQEPKPATVVRQQEEFIRRMKYEGTLDSYFDALLKLRSPENPTFLVDIVDTYLVESANLIDRLQHEMISKTVAVNDGIVKDIIQLRASSASLGGVKVAEACVEVKEAYDEHKLKIMESFAKLKNEYESFRAALSAIGKMERTTLAVAGSNGSATTSWT